MRHGAACATACVVLLIAGCTGVPPSSAPETVEHLGQTLNQPTPLQPRPGVDPRGLVIDFLTSNEVDAAAPGASRVYLTPAARNRWSDTPISVVDSTQVGPYDAAHHTVIVTGRSVGTIDRSGNYTPDLAGSGSGGDILSFKFVIRQVAGQNRIDQLSNGLILTETQFERSFLQRVVYFYDASEQYLVPDVRYVAVGDAETTANWLVGQLVTGPRPELQNAETNLEFPAQANPRHVVVQLGSPTVIDVPGAAELDSGHRNRLAAQIAQTLDQVTAGGTFQLHDNGKRVWIPAVKAATFTADQIGEATQVEPQVPSPPSVYYVHGGGLVTSDGKPVPGGVGSGAYGLRSVAVARQPGSSQLFVAGTSGAQAAEQRLLLGTVARGLRTTTVAGALTRPSWAAGRDEAWVAAGAKVFRVSSAGKVDAVTVSALPAGGQIIALRVSPEGARVAMVISEKGAAQVYVGTIARGDAQLRIDGATAITPVGFRVNDVAWNDPLKLFLIGAVIDNGEPQVTEVQVDGSLWTPHRIGDLPQAPDSITVAENQPAWVSVVGTVWTQSGGSWISPTSAGETFGTDPVYLE